MFYVTFGQAERKYRVLRDFLLDTGTVWVAVRCANAAEVTTFWSWRGRILDIVERGR